MKKEPRYALPEQALSVVFKANKPSFKVGHSADYMRSIADDWLSRPALYPRLVDTIGGERRAYSQAYSCGHAESRESVSVCLLGLGVLVASLELCKESRRGLLLTHFSPDPATVSALFSGSIPLLSAPWVTSVEERVSLALIRLHTLAGPLVAMAYVDNPQSCGGTCRTLAELASRLRWKDGIARVDSTPNSDQAVLHMG